MLDKEFKSLVLKNDLKKGLNKQMNKVKKSTEDPN
jgi:hypothetical protein